MLSEGERKFLVELLAGLKEADLIALASTSTSGKLSPKGKRDAIECILLHSDSAETILKRKKITKDFLFNYLHGKKVTVLVSDEKPKLIELILRLWHDASSTMQYTSQKDVINFAGNLPGDNSSPTITTLVHNNILLNVASSQLGSCNINFGMASPLLQNSVPSPISPVSSSSDQKMLPIGDDNLDTLALKFSEWFYNLLNKNFKGGLIALNSEHFWDDADFVLRIKSTSSFSSTGIVNVDSNLFEEECVKGISDIILLLNKIKDRYQIYFSPNLCTGGVKGKLDIHGGVLVLACGTLHKDIGQMCGGFEQVFLIFRDPLTADNWKIKKSELNLISINQSNVLTSPTINETTLQKFM